MAAIARDFDATIIKNRGDGVIYHFPKQKISLITICFEKCF
jgi:hypothetical protein